VLRKAGYQKSQRNPASDSRAGSFAAAPSDREIVRTASLTKVPSLERPAAE